MAILQGGRGGGGAETRSPVAVRANSVDGGAAPTRGATRGGHPAHDPTQRGDRGRPLSSYAPAEWKRKMKTKNMRHKKRVVATITFSFALALDKSAYHVLLQTPLLKPSQVLVSKK